MGIWVELKWATRAVCYLHCAYIGIKNGHTLEGCGILIYVLGYMPIML